MAAAEVDTLLARYDAELQRARKEAEGWARRVLQLEGAIGGLHTLRAEVSPQQTESPAATPATRKRKK